MPSNGHPSYPNPIIQEAICEIAFRLQDNMPWDPRWSGDFFVAVRDEFPNLQSFAAPTLFSFQIGPSSLPPQPINVFRFGHASRQVLLQLSDNRIVVNVLPKYPGWEQVSADIQYAWERIIKVINPAAITRIGLRYINRIERSAPDETLGKWLVATDYVPQGVLDSLSGALLSQVQAKLDEHNKIAVVIGEQEAIPNTNGAFIFDVDRTLEREITPDARTLFTETSRLHEDVWKTFSSAKGERLEKIAERNTCMSASAAISADRIFLPMFQTGSGYAVPVSNDRPKGIKTRFVRTGALEEKAQEPARNELPAISETGYYAEELSRIQQLNFYLGNVRDAGDISQGTATLALRAWANVSELLAQNLPVPDAAPGPEGQLLFAWNKGEHHLELEIFPDSPSQFFYFNRVSNESWEDEYNVNTPVSQQAKDKLSIFTSTK